MCTGLRSIDHSNLVYNSCQSRSACTIALEIHSHHILKKQQESVNDFLVISHLDDQPATTMMLYVKGEAVVAVWLWLLVHCLPPSSAAAARPLIIDIIAS